MFDVNTFNSHLIFASIAIFKLVSGELSSAGHFDCKGNWDEKFNARYFNRCEVEVVFQRLTCFGGLDDAWNSGSSTIQSLTLCGWTEENINPKRILRKFPNLENLNVFDSNLTYLDGPFPNTAEKLRTINFNRTMLRTLSDDAFSNLPSLRVLDLRYNRLEMIKAETIEAPSLERIYLFGNPWKCSLEMTWILNLNNDSVARRVVDRDKLLCVKPFETCQVVTVVEILVELNKECLMTVCSCELTWVNNRPIAETPGQDRAFVSVNCTSKGFTELPSFLPANTTTLYLSENKIKDLTPLKKNPIYRRVIDIYLDDNVVESITYLEDSDWLEHFRVLSLTGNRLTDLPTYALDNAIQHNQNRIIAKIFLGDNPWTCDCQFTPGFQNLMLRHPNLFNDVNNITCKYVKDDENSGKQIQDLSRTAICILADEESWVQLIDVLNAVLASLILLVLGKLLYDYWTFKKSGQLPWIVSRIP